MIVQTAAAGQPQLVIRQTDHALMSGQFAELFGNREFARPTPWEPLVYAATHHDEGWSPIDARVEMDLTTGLPYHLTNTPLPYLLQTSAGSPTFNEAYHPFSGILSSMHTYGLFHGRYGLSDKIVINLIPEEHKAGVMAMLDEELRRQARLKSVLRESAATTHWISDSHLLYCYKLLQFFDTLALYFQMTHPEGRGMSEFPHVPQDLDSDVTLTIHPLAAGIYALSPYPFQDEEASFSYQGRPMTPQEAGTDLVSLAAAIVPVTDTVTLVKGAAV